MVRLPLDVLEPYEAAAERQDRKLADVVAERLGGQRFELEQRLRARIAGSTEAKSGIAARPKGKR